MDGLDGIGMEVSVCIDSKSTALRCVHNEEEGVHDDDDIVDVNGGGGGGGGDDDDAWQYQ